ncbi:hypothetical protein LEN26_001614 [Aphanomyces euteiches]|uniref:Uncharacterized protein n=1 Tax=Aphanomyces euteiches TaxID=100861 RepID=A0A6G0WLM8_9STRA|nr:hypothetical protein Ae201684_014012 [Aphanomyces euteiches]KAH9124030.1 hypothetical protein AeMF1_005134 [Aphanomyces euteiches]KAH9142825.1 hypothetical protein AeRB84_013123 [Aphanomyces euteiches]KAH9161017.1 hypothetical protein LEN26_001614 [Aphanomyces euteiches]KAH9189016.1 hypothetical protein AeNC1_009007 [Aphanomyces euteiches]
MQLQWLCLSAMLLVVASSPWRMERVVSIQARVQGDKPVWDASHRTFVSSFGTTFYDKYVAGFDSINLASVEGVLKYVQSEGINQNFLAPCERKNKMQYVVFYEITIVQPSAAIAQYGSDSNIVPEYCPFVAMDSGMCTPVAGSQLPDDCIQLFGSAQIPAIGPCIGAGRRDSDARAPYPNTVWFSFPNSCITQPWTAKTQACRAEFPGGLCPFGVSPDGTTCSYNYSVLGFINLDDLVGITNLTHSQTQQPYASYAEFCRDKAGLYRGIVFRPKDFHDAEGVEFQAPDGSQDNNAVTSLPFWRRPFDAQANQERAQTLIAMYNEKATARGSIMRPLPYPGSLRNPPCYKNSESCADAPFGCKRELYGQICRICGAADTGCIKAPSTFQFPQLARATLAPTPPPSPTPSSLPVAVQAMDIGSMQTQLPSISSRAVVMTWHAAVAMVAFILVE